MRPIQSCAGPVPCGGCEVCLAVRSRPAAELAEADAEFKAELDYELSAAFGPDVEVVNLLTGERRRTR